MMDAKLLLISESPAPSLREWLSGQGYDVDVATDDHAALQLSSKQEYAVALVDDHVHSKPGIELFSELGARRPLDGILCCEKPTVDDVDAAIRAGMEHVVAKPVDRREVVRLIEGLIRETARSFDRRYPEATPGFVSDEGMIKSSEAFWCESCNRSTHWKHKDLQTYFCCEDCLVRYNELS